MHLPLPAALVGAHRWAVHGGRSLILWRRESVQTRLDTVTVCAPEQGRNRSLMYFSYYFRGFREVCLWWKNVSGLFILPGGAPYIIVLKLLCRCVCMTVCAQLYLKTSHCMRKDRQNLSVLGGMRLSYSPPSFGGEGISEAAGVKGRAKLSARLRGRASQGARSTLHGFSQAR